MVGVGTALAYFAIGQPLGLVLLFVLCRRWGATRRESITVIMWTLVWNGVAYFTVAPSVASWTVALRQNLHR
jgi:hypothetical protein